MRKISYIFVVLLCLSCGSNIFHSDPSEDEDKIKAAAVYLQKKENEEAKRILLTMLPNSAKTLLAGDPTSKSYYENLSASLSSVKKKEQVLTLLADYYVQKAGGSIITFLVSIASKKSTKGSVACSSQQKFIYVMSKSLSVETVSSYKDIVKAQYLVDTVTLSSSYKDDSTASVLSLQEQINRKKALDVSVSIKTVIYDLMGIMAVMASFKPKTGASEIDDAKAQTIRRSMLHISKNAEGSGSQATFVILKNTKIAKFISDVRFQESSSGSTGLVPFKLWAAAMLDHSCGSS